MLNQFNQSKRFYNERKENFLKKGKTPPRAPEYYELCVEAAKVDGLWLEFGVYEGKSAYQLTHAMNRYGIDKPLYGFDSFKGLPEDWILDPNDAKLNKKAGFFKVADPTKRGWIMACGKKLELVVGWFDKTLPKFVQTHTEPCALINIDSDLYSSAKTVLDTLAGQIVPGTVIMFDEYHGYKNYKDGEYKAFKEFVAQHNVKFEWLAYVHDGKQAVCRIKSIG